MCFLLPQDALNCGLFLASPHFFKHTYRREKFISQNKENIKNLVKQIKQTNLNPDTPNEIRYFMDEIKTIRARVDNEFRSGNSLDIPRNFLNFFYKKEILINLQKMAKYFDKLMLKIFCDSDFSNEFKIYFIKLPTGKTIFMNYDFPRYVCICFKSLKITFCQRTYLDSLRCSNAYGTAYELIEGFLCFAVNTCYELKLEIVDFELKPLTI
jgi:hypothetical protein